MKRLIAIPNFLLLSSMLLLLSCSSSLDNGFVALNNNEPTLTYTARLTNGSIIRSTEVNIEFTCSDLGIIEKEIQEYTYIVERVSMIKQMMGCAVSFE